MTVWGVVFGLGVIIALGYYFMRQSKDEGIKIFPHNVVETAELTKDEN